ncbi:MAG: N-acetyltransferase family protein, partial [Lentisphaerota bacterium]
MIRNCLISDAQAICDIYNHYIQNTVITFEESPLVTKDIAERIKTVTEKYPWLVYDINGEIMGYAYAGEFKSRCAYRYTLETSVYLSSEHTSKGIGTELY